MTDCDRFTFLPKTILGLWNTYQKLTKMVENVKVGSSTVTGDVTPAFINYYRNRPKSSRTQIALWHRHIEFDNSGTYCNPEEAFVEDAHYEESLSKEE